MTLRDDLGGIPGRCPVLATQLEGVRTLEHVLDWMKREGHSFAAMDMITQDEYSHDLLLPVGTDWLAFGMT
ncbi:MAG TPA: hypothetical protein VKD71_01595 [Gemmataceae bacterium]|nr:hypothetical protein [Gemmataceae bacterium]